MKRTTDVPGI